MAGLVIGIGLQLVIPVQFLPANLVSRALGLLLVVGGVALAAWAVKALAEVDAAKPDRLAVAGPYAWSRNPMYLAWDAIYVGITLAANAVWPLVVFPLAFLWNHLQIVNEERYLDRQFGAAYRGYRSKTRRYL